MPRAKAVRLGLVAACAGVLVALVVTFVALHGQTHPVKLVQPRHTAHPLAPGIAIAHQSFDLPDPFIFTDKAKYYLYLSSAFGNTTQNIPMFVGEPGHWGTIVRCCSGAPAVGGPRPDVVAGGLQVRSAVRDVLLSLGGGDGSPAALHCHRNVTHTEGPVHRESDPLRLSAKFGR